MATRVALRIEGLCAFQRVSFPAAKTFALMDQEAAHQERHVREENVHRCHDVFVYAVFCIGGEVLDRDRHLVCDGHVFEIFAFSLQSKDVYL